MAQVIQFVTFRRAFLGLVALISWLCLALALYVQPLFYGNQAAITLVLLPVVVILITIFAAIRKPLCRSPQLVVHEIIGSFILSMFQFALCFAFLLLSVTINDPTFWVVTLLKAVIYINSGLVITYTFIITLAAIITLQTVDPDIGSRDIESEPCPLPFATIFSYTSPFRQKSPPPNSHTQFCLPGCACSRKLSSEDLVPPRPVYIPQTQESSPFSPRWSGRHFRRQGIVRMPTPLERSASIYVAFR